MAASEGKSQGIRNTDVQIWPKSISHNIEGPQPAELGYHKHAVARIALAEEGAP